LGLTAFSQGQHTIALVHARDVLKSEPKNSAAWVLCSQAHFQLGEIDAAEMTILEAIRHDPMNVETRLEYLRIARETLASDRYLQELEKSRELFPDSVDILWELARRYHVVEKMPVTASILYQKVLEKAPTESSIAQQAKVELIKIEQLP
jgi:tetratricopeptide (TPR) repeat protein